MRSLILLHGYVLLFGYIFAVQAGLPIPSDPILLIMGAAIGDGHYRFAAALSLAVAAALLGDLIWFELGRWRGRSILKLLCRFALEPDTCVRQTEVTFARRGAWTLLFTKFVPGSGLISTPLAGAIKMPRWQFLLADAGGATIWACCYLLLGYLFHKQVTRLIELLGLFGRRAGLIVILLLAAFVAYRYFQRMRFRRQLRINRISTEEAYERIFGDPPAMVVDLRSPIEIQRTGKKIAGAVVLRPAELRAHFDALPQDRGVILYCT